MDLKTKTLRFMNKTTFTWAAAIAALAVTGCYNPNGTPDNTANGVIAGAGSGALLGALIGGATHNVGEGAAIGAASGAVLGGLIGHSVDQQQDMRIRQQYPDTYQRASAGTPLSLVDVKALSAAHIGDDIIIAQISNSHTVYHLTANDLIDLKNAGVSDKVVAFMENTPSLIPAAPVAVVQTAPPPPPVEPVVVAPGPGYVWVGGEWVWSGGWYWRAGYWDVPAYPGGIWIGGYWGRGPRGWEYHGGHWGRR